MKFGQDSLSCADYNVDGILVSVRNKTAGNIYICSRWECYEIYENSILIHFKVADLMMFTLCRNWLKDFKVLIYKLDVVHQVTT